MITLYHAPQSRSSRIIWLLEEIGAPYEIKPVSIFRPMTGQGASDPGNPHPDQRVPAIVHDGQLAAESVAIVLYLTEAFPEAGLAPTAGSIGRGDYLTWLAWYAAEMEPAMVAAMTGEIERSEQARRGHAQVVRRIETALASGPYMMGDRFTGADLLVASALAFGRQVFPESATIDAYMARCRERPANVRAMALDDASGLQQAA